MDFENIPYRTDSESKSECLPPVPGISACGNIAF
jgi:hypothetical protein